MATLQELEQLEGMTDKRIKEYCDFIDKKTEEGYSFDEEIIEIVNKFRRLYLNYRSENS